MIIYRHVSFLLRKFQLSIVMVLTLASCKSNELDSAAYLDKVQLAATTEAQCGSTLLTVSPGDIPIIVTAPHAGSDDLGPSGVSERNCLACKACLAPPFPSDYTHGGQTRSCANCSSCRTGNDSRTAAVANAIVSEVENQTGGRPYLVMAHFDRKYIDPNRPDSWAAHEDNDHASPCYDAYHKAVRDFVDEIRAEHNRQGLLLDIHGFRRVLCEGGSEDGEICKDGETDKCEDGGGTCTDESWFNNICRGTRDGSAVSELRAQHGDEAILGPNSIFGQLETTGYNVYPPNRRSIDARLESNCYNGGHTVKEYGASNADGIDAIQFEFGTNLRKDHDTAKATGEDVGSAVSVFYETYLSRATTQAHAGAIDETGDAYGTAIAVGDFNGDGKDDIATGVPGEDDTAIDEGMVVVTYGGSAGVERLVQGHAGSLGEAGDAFGSSLITGDFNKDGYDDLAVGIPLEDQKELNDGLVIVFYGSSVGLLRSIGGVTKAVSSERITQEQAYAESEVGDRFGTSLSVGDYNRDGYADLAVGLPYENVDNEDDGLTIVFYGSAQGLLKRVGSTARAVSYERLVQSHSGASSQANDKFGASLSTGDYDGDGYDDLAVGVPGEDHADAIDNGLVIVHYGSSRGLIIVNPPFSRAVRSERLAQNHVKATEEEGDAFGQSLASGDFNGDGKDDLVIGVPNENVGGVDTGAVMLFYGSEFGLLITVLGNTHAVKYHRLDQTSAGAQNEANDRFGTSLVAGDFDRDGFDDLAIGVPTEDSNGATNTGMVIVFYSTGTPGFIKFSSYERRGQNVLGVDESYDFFGQTLASGDVNGDGYTDLLIGAPLEDRLDAQDSGAVYSLYGGTSGLRRFVGSSL